MRPRTHTNGQAAAAAGREPPRVPNISPDFISKPITGGGKIKILSSSAGARAAQPGSSPSPQRNGELAERAASWRMEITLAATRADSCSAEGRKEAELPMDIGHGNNGRVLWDIGCSSEQSLCKAPLLSHPCFEFPLKKSPGQVPQDGGNIGFLLTRLTGW